MLSTAWIKHPKCWTTGDWVKKGSLQTLRWKFDSVVRCSVNIISIRSLKNVLNSCTVQVSLFMLDTYMLLFNGWEFHNYICNYSLKYLTVSGDIRPVCLQDKGERWTQFWFNTGTSSLNWHCRGTRHPSSTIHFPVLNGCWPALKSHQVSIVLIWNAVLPGTHMFDIISVSSYYCYSNRTIWVNSWLDCISTDYHASYVT